MTLCCSGQPSAASSAPDISALWFKIQDHHKRPTQMILHCSWQLLTDMLFLGETRITGVSTLIYGPKPTAIRKGCVSTLAYKLSDHVLNQVGYYSRHWQLSQDWFWALWILQGKVCTGRFLCCMAEQSLCLSNAVTGKRVHIQSQKTRLPCSRPHAGSPVRTCVKIKKARHIVSAAINQEQNRASHSKSGSWEFQSS